MLIDYMNADAEGHVDTFYRTRNVLKQKGPSCGIHALYNIVESHLSESGGAPDYAAFESAVQKALGPSWNGKTIGKDVGISGDELVKAAKAVGLEAKQVRELPAAQADFDALLASREGAAWISIKYAESRSLGKMAASNHAIFIGEKWTDAAGKTWYTIADSNGGASDLGFMSWEQLQPRLNTITLLRPEAPAAFAERVGTFVNGERAPPKAGPALSVSAKLPGPDAGPGAQGAFWEKASKDPSFAAEVYKQNRGIFTSVREVQQYALGRLKVINEGLANYEVKAPSDETGAKQEVKTLKPVFEEPAKGRVDYAVGTQQEAMAAALRLTGIDPLTAEKLLDAKTGEVIGFKSDTGEVHFHPSDLAGHAAEEVGGDPAATQPHVNYKSYLEGRKKGKGMKYGHVLFTP